MLNRVAGLFLLIALAGAAGCTTTGNRTTNASLPSPTAEAELALAFQADPKFGRDLNSAERTELSAAELKALEYGEDGQAIRWKGASDGVSGVVTTYRPFRVGSSTCRRFQHNVSIMAERASVNGTACRKGEGGWKLAQ